MSEKAVISDERHLKKWPPPSWIYYFSRFWSHGLFSVATNHLTLAPGWAGSYTCPALRPYQLGPMREQLTTFLQSFMNLFQSAADFLCCMLKYKMVAVATMLSFIFCLILW